jgi:CheY-like chemotaxis protein
MEVKRKILVVDDAPMFRELESLFLARSGRVITAADGEEALATARRERPDVIVTDLSMPGLSGDVLCRRIKRDPDLGRTPVIIVTSQHDGAEHERAVRAGADDVVEKPVNRVSLIQTVNHFLRLAERGLVRVPLETDVKLALPGQETWGRSRNISRGGIFVELSHASPEPETELQIEFALPDAGAPLSPTAKVVWRRLESEARAGVGLQFLRLGGNAARLLDEFIYERAELTGTELAGAPA